MRRIQALLSIPLAIAVALGVSACSGEQKADELFENGDYQEALEAYEGLEATEDIQEKMNECRVYLAAEYIRSQGEIVVNLPMTELSADRNKVIVEGTKDGGFILTYHYEDFNFDSQVATEVDYKMEIPHNEPMANLSGEITYTTIRAKATQTGTGTFDIGTYDYGDTIEWDETTDTAQTSLGINTYLGVGVIDYNASTVEEIVKALRTALIQTSTGCTLQMVGFEQIAY